MAIVIGINAYADVAQADAYFSTRLGANAWVVADESTKEAALITATHIFNAMKWDGVPLVSTQLFAFPRRLLTTNETIPSGFIIAVYELALHLLVNPELLEETGSVEDISVGPISLSTIKRAPLFTTYIKRLISPYTVGSGNVVGHRAWWRAN